jgi:ubiquinone/menaquinone biosynthesis C-methylase UbiE
MLDAAARRPLGGSASLARADARVLPFPTGAFDAVIATLTLHHFREDDATQVLREMARVSRGVVLISDLERSLPHYAGARFLAATWWRRNPFTRHDGPLSVLRSFTQPELEALAGQAGLVRVAVRRHFPFRLVLEGRPEARGGT